MKKQIFNLINIYDSIIIARHKNPDFDAYGSQFGLYYALREYFPKKNIYVVGDDNSLNKFQTFDNVSDETYKESLVLILDTVASQMLDPVVYKNYDKLVFIDHHRNDPDIDYDIVLQEKDASSTAEIITSLLIDWDIPINLDSARALYIGIIGDTGRFMHNNTTSRTLMFASKLLETGIDISKIHNSIYTENKESKNVKNKFFNLVQYTKNNVAYSKNDKDFLEKYNLSTNYTSRGLVNQMAGMEEVHIWVNFTFDQESEKIICEIRSRDIAVLDVAKKYGGGGHLNACGCTVNTWEETDKIIKDLDKLMEENI